MSQRCDPPSVAQVRAGAWREAHDFVCEHRIVEVAAAQEILAVADFIERTGLGWEEYLERKGKR